MTWFNLTGDARLGRCASEDCGGQPTWRFEADGIGSNYCSGCKARIIDALAPRSEVQSDVPVAWQYREKMPNGSWGIWRHCDIVREDPNLDYRPLFLGAAQEAWMPIETAPKDRTRILLFQAGRGAFEGWWHTAWPHPEEYWMDDADSEPNPTHWRPTLAPPSADRS